MEPKEQSYFNLVTGNYVDEPPEAGVPYLYRNEAGETMMMPGYNPAFAMSPPAPSRVDDCEGLAQMYSVWYGWGDDEWCRFMAFCEEGCGGGGDPCPDGC